MIYIGHGSPNALFYICRVFVYSLLYFSLPYFSTLAGFGFKTIVTSLRGSNIASLNINGTYPHLPEKCQLLLLQPLGSAILFPLKSYIALWVCVWSISFTSTNFYFWDRGARPSGQHLFKIRFYITLGHNHMYIVILLS